MTLAIDWLYDFETFSPVHFGVVAFFTILWGAWIVACRRGRKAEWLVPMERSLAAVAFVVWLAAETYWMMPGRFSAAYSLPLHLCDITALLVPVALWWRGRRMMTLVYFWGLVFSIQAVITPALHDGPAELWFWLFWAYHFMILASAVYFVVVRGFRPRWPDLFYAMVMTALYVAVILPLDVVMQWNYGFLGNMKPSQPSVIDVLGPWPWRVVVMIVLGGVAMAVLYLPWRLVRR